MTESRPSPTELEFRLRDDRYPIVDATADASCECVLRELLPTSDSGFLQFFEVLDSDPESLERAVDDRAAAEADVVDHSGDADIVSVTLEDPSRCVVTTLADCGAFLRAFRAADGEARILAAVRPAVEAGSVADFVTDEHPSVTLVAKRERPQELLFVKRPLASALTERLTDRQQEVLVAAFEGGYFERPRATTGAELADQLDITSATFSQHLRAAQRKVFSTMFHDGISADDAEYN